MKIARALRVATIGIACIAGAGWNATSAAAAASEAWAALPAAVRATFEAQRPGEVPTEVETERDGERTLYEAEYRGGPSNADITVDDKGALVVVKTKIKAKDLPPAVVNALNAQYPGAKIVEVESTSLATFELDLRVKGKKTEIVAKADGSLSEHTEDEDDSEDDDEETDAAPAAGAKN